MFRTGMLALLVFGFMLAGFSGAAYAQDQGRGRGNFDPAQARERMMTRYKEQLGASDEEWKVLEPRVEKVMTAQREARTGGLGFAFGGGGPGGGFGRGGDRGGRGGDQPQTAVTRATAELRQAIESNASAEVLSQRLAAVREARAKARQDLEAAQKDLRELVTARQEAVLVIAGLLE